MKKVLLTVITILEFVITTMAQVTVTITAGGSTTFCQGNNVQLTSLVVPSGVYQYQWVKNGTSITGANVSSYIADASGTYFLKATDLSSNVYNSDTIIVTVNPLPTQPSITYNSPSIICNGSSINLLDNSSTNVSYQWHFNNNPISGSINNIYVASNSGTYKLIITDLTTGCSNTSLNVDVGEMPYIVNDTLITCGDSTTISLTNHNFSFSTLPAACNADMSNASIVTTTTTDGGNKIVCYGGDLTINGSGSGTFVVEYGGTLNGFGGGGSNTAYVKAGGIYNFNSGGGGGNVVYYEPGAIINGGTTQLVQCANIGVVYPTNTNALCNNLIYLWSNGATTPTISVTPTQPTTYSVTVSNGSLSCIDSVVVTVNTIDTFVVLSGSTLTANTLGAVYQWIDCNTDTPISGATNQSFTATVNGNYAVIVTQNGCSDTSTCYNINTLGISENIFASTINIYPNPSTGKFIIEVTGYNGNASILQIFNVLGEQIYSTQINSEKEDIYLNKQANGIYFYKINNENGILNTGKIIIE